MIYYQLKSDNSPFPTYYIEISTSKPSTTTQSNQETRRASSDTYPSANNYSRESQPSVTFSPSYTNLNLGNTTHNTTINNNAPQPQGTATQEQKEKKKPSAVDAALLFVLFASAMLAVASIYKHFMNVCHNYVARLKLNSDKIRIAGVITASLILGFAGSLVVGLAATALVPYTIVAVIGYTLGAILGFGLSMIGFDWFTQPSSKDNDPLYSIDHFSNATLQLFQDDYNIGENELKSLQEFFVDLIEYYPTTRGIINEYALNKSDLIQCLQSLRQGQANDSYNNQRLEQQSILFILERKLSSCLSDNNYRTDTDTDENRTLQALIKLTAKLQNAAASTPTPTRQEGNTIPVAQEVYQLSELLQPVLPSAPPAEASTRVTYNEKISGYKI
jgi:hypothetical protein